LADAIGLFKSKYFVRYCWSGVDGNLWRITDVGKTFTRSAGGRMLRVSITRTVQDTPLG
jgi:hypothetical protein